MDTSLKNSLLADVDQNCGADFKFGAPIFEFRFGSPILFAFVESIYLCGFFLAYDIESLCQYIH